MYGITLPTKTGAESPCGQKVHLNPTQWKIILFAYGQDYVYVVDVKPFSENSDFHTAQKPYEWQGIISIFFISHLGFGFETSRFSTQES